MPKHRKEAVRGLRLPVVPLMGGLALAGGAALLLSGPGGTSPLASLDAATESKTLEYDVSLVNTEFATGPLCFIDDCEAILGLAASSGGGGANIFGGGGGISSPAPSIRLPLALPGGGGAGCSATVPRGTNA